MHEYKNPEEKIAAAQSATPNEWQQHNYSANDSPGHLQPAEVAEIGERQPRVVEKSKVNHGGRHVRDEESKPDGQKQKPLVDREASVMANRKASEKLFDSNRRSVAPNHKSK